MVSASADTKRHDCIRKNREKCWLKKRHQHVLLLFYEI
jgi:hypothetical protein